MQETRDQFLGWEDPLEKVMATHPSILSWRIPWTEEPGGLQSTGSQKPMYYWDFPGGSDGKESACKAGNLTSIPGLGWEDALE